MENETKPLVLNEAELLDEDEKAALNAQLKHNQVIAGYQLEILKRIQRLEKLGGEQDYTHTIRELLNAFGGSINMSFLSPVCADHALFAKARKTMIASGEIVEIQDKNRKILKLV